MSIEDIIRTISFIVAPAVMISACTLFLNGLLSRYESISARMRAMHRERLDLLQASTEGDKGGYGFATQRIQEIEHQLPSILHRHRLIRNAILSVNSAILVFVLSMFMIASAVISKSSVVGTTALFIFLLGTGALLLGVAITSIELSRSQQEVSYEIKHGLSLTKEDMRY